MSGKLKDKVAVITGGVHGLGKKAVEKFLAEGAKVILWDIEERKNSETGEANYQSVFFQKVDITNSSIVNAAAKIAFEKFGRIDILLNVAGITRNATRLKMTQDEWKQVVDVNLSGLSNCTKSLSPYMMKNKYGRIINTSSMVGLYGNFGQTNYNAAKSGVVGISKVWARELTKSGITVNTVSPGVIETETMSNVPDEVIRSLKEKIPAGRLGSYEDIVNAYIFLASAEASYISGALINVDGGFIA